MGNKAVQNTGDESLRLAAPDVHNAPVNDVTLAQVRILLIAAHGTCCVLRATSQIAKHVKKARIN